MNAWVGAASLACSVNCHAAPDKVAYELRERCGKQASAEFKREFGVAGKPITQSGTTSLYNFQNHYNSKLNACIYLLRSNGFETARSKKPGESAKAHEMQALIDLNENREIGSYFKFSDAVAPIQCEVAGRTCQSKVEWEGLIKPYLEE